MRPCRHCNTLQHVTIRYNILQQTRRLEARRCCTLQHTTACCNMLQHARPHCKRTHLEASGVIEKYTTHERVTSHSCICVCVFVMSHVAIVSDVVLTRMEVQRSDMSRRVSRNTRGSRDTRRSRHTCGSRRTRRDKNCVAVKHKLCLPHTEALGDFFFFGKMASHSSSRKHTHNFLLLDSFHSTAFVFFSTTIFSHIHFFLYWYSLRFFLDIGIF